MRLTLVSAALAGLLCGCGATTQAALRPTQQPATHTPSGSPSASVVAPHPVGSSTAASSSAPTSSSAPAPSSTPTGSPAPTPSTTPSPEVNTRLGVTGAQTARLLNADGSAQGATDVFQSATDRKILAVMSLANLPAGTKISYVRYLDGKYVDSRSAVLAKTSKYMYFDFNALPGKNFTPGHYRLRLYVNEAAAWETVYQVT